MRERERGKPLKVTSLPCCTPLVGNRMGDVETIMAQLRVAASVHSIDWLHAQVGSLLAGAGQGGTVPAPPLCHGLRGPGLRSAFAQRYHPGSSATLGAPRRLPLGTLRLQHKNAKPTRHQCGPGGILSLNGTRGMGRKWLAWPIPRRWVRCKVRRPGMAIWPPRWLSQGETGPRELAWCLEQLMSLPHRSRWGSRGLMAALQLVGSMVVRQEEQGDWLHPTRGGKCPAGQ